MKGVKEGRSPSYKLFPLPLLREGGEGDRLLNDLNKGMGLEE